MYIYIICKMVISIQHITSARPCEACLGIAEAPSAG